MSLFVGSLGVGSFCVWSLGVESLNVGSLGAGSLGARSLGGWVVSCFVGVLFLRAKNNKRFFLCGRNSCKMPKD